MSAYNTTLLDEDNNEIYPKTLAENVYDGNTRMDQKVDGIRTDLGVPSSASAVTGADAFSKISKLNSDLTPVAMTFDNYVTFDSSKATKTGTNYIYKEGNNVYAHINFNTKTDTSAQVIVGSISLKPKGDIYITAIRWSDKAIVPIALQNTGNIKMYNPLANTEYSFYVAYVV